MKKKLLKILFITLWVILAAGVVTLAGFTMSVHQDVVCRNYTINIDYGEADVLVTNDDIYSLICKSGFLLKGQRVRFIDAEKIESMIRKQPYVADAQVYLTMEGDVTIRILQRQPILRIFNQRGESYYIDAKGKVLPLNPAFPARVLVASGYIEEPLQRNLNYSVDSVCLKDSLMYRSVVNHLLKVAMYVIKVPFLKAQIEQIYVDPNGEMELIPRVGNHVILFGNADNIADKFNRLYIFYKKGLNRTGWDRYPVINIKYQQQVVCSKI
jgi:cell division protein FtsQ